MKKLVFSSLIILITVSTPYHIYALDKIPDKVLNNFQESFPEVKNVHWHAYKDYVEAYFTYEKLSCRIDYSLDGKFIEEIKYLAPELLRKDISSKILIKFPEKQIFGVTEVVNNNKTEYFIILKDDKNWFNVIYNSRGQIKLVKVFTNAS